MTPAVASGGLSRLDLLKSHVIMLLLFTKVCVAIQSDPVDSLKTLTDCDAGSSVMRYSEQEYW